MLSVDWDPLKGAASALLLANNASPSDPTGYITATHEAAGQFALDAAFVAEACFAAGLDNPLPSALRDVAVSRGILIVSATSDANVLGDKLRSAAAVLSDEADPARPVTTAGQGAMFYLAMIRALRGLVNTSRPVQVDSPTVALPPNPLTENSFAVGPLALLIVTVGVVGAVAAAGYAWVKHDTEVEAVKQQTALEIDKARLAAQVKLATDLAAAQLAAGQTVSIPDVVRSLGRQEYLDVRVGPYIAGALVALGIGAGAWAAYKRRTLTEAVKP